jgi:hypothetical protein
MVIVEATPGTSEIDLKGVVDERRGVRYFGKARRGLDGCWTCLAQVGGTLCFVEVSMRPTVHIDGDPGDEDVPRNW